MQKHSGTILLMILIFLLIIALSISNALMNSSLHVKMNHYYQNKIIALTAAENKLTATEDMLINRIIAPPDNGATSQAHTQFESTDTCNNKKYLIFINTKYQNASVNLESEYQKNQIPEKKGCEKLKQAGERLWWLEN